MVLSIPRKLILYLIEIGIQVLWVLDRITNFSFRDLARFIKGSFVAAISLFFVFFLGYSYRTGFLNKVAEGLFLNDIPTPTSVIIDFPILSKSIPIPQVSAKSVLAIDRKTNRILFEKEPSLKSLPASTVKLMTAIVSLDIYNLEDELKVSRYCFNTEGTKAYLPEGEIYKVEDLINGMLVGSAGDAACVLATSKIEEKDFVDLMNKKASEIGMNSTKFSNPVGLDNINGGHYSTAEDLYKLAKYATSKSVIENAVRSEVYIILSTDKLFSTTLRNTNRLLLEIPGSIGIKTGTTENAGEVLIYEYKDNLKDIVIVVMGSRDRFTDTKLILNWIIDSYSWN
jgi:D-alanyl-D-alanine carboxypeptidase (penicillin-binding protein 5/6)